MPEMDAPRALVFRPLVKGNEALGTRLPMAEVSFLSSANTRKRASASREAQKNTLNLNKSGFVSE